MFAIFVTYAVIPAFCISSQNFMEWKHYKPKSSLLWKEEKGKKNKKKTTEDDCLYPALNIVYKCVTEIRENKLRKIPCFCFVHLHASTDSMTNQRRWENIQSKIHVRWCTWKVHVKQMFPEAPWGARKINDQSYLMFESPTVLHLPATSGRYIDTEHLCRLIRLKGVVVAGLPVWMPIQHDCSYCCQPEPKLQSRALRTIYWATDARISGSYVVSALTYKEAHSKRVACHI